MIDHVRLVNTDDKGEISVYAEGLIEPPNFKIEDQGKTILIKDIRPVQIEEEADLDKVCSVEPNFTSYRVQIPGNKNVYISILEGNLYSDGFKGQLNVKVEDGIIKLSKPTDQVRVKLNTGSVIVKDIVNARIDAETNMGILNTDLKKEAPEKHRKNLVDTIGKPYPLINIRAIMANIYLYGQKG